jgi:hypothetical protein
MCRIADGVEAARTRRCRKGNGDGGDAGGLWGQGDGSEASVVEVRYGTAAALGQSCAGL